MSDVNRWLQDLGFGEYVRLFVENKIDWEVLPDLTNEDLASLGIPLGHRKKMLRAIARLAIVEGADGRAPLPAGADEGDPIGLGPVTAERRHLTVVFCDLVGSTALSGQLDPEDLSSIVRAHQNCCAEIVTRMGGFIARYMGDGMLVYFGFPRAHEDDVERAVRAGLQIIEAAGSLKTKNDLALQTRVGIATGLVVVGDMIGVGAVKEIAAIGETPNVAARLQSLAEPNTVVVDAQSHRLVQGLFNSTNLGKLDLKGVGEQVQAWRIDQERALADRFEARRGPHLVPFVNREHELALLLDRWQLVKEGEGQLVLLSGEPGIGKSRLIQAFCSKLTPDPHQQLYFYCSPHHESSSLYPFLEYLRRAAKLAPQDGPTKRLKKLDAFLSRWVKNPNEVLGPFHSLLSLPTGQSPDRPANAEFTMDKILDTLVEQVTSLTADKPLLVIIEDVHWIDPTSQEFLERVVANIQNLALLIIVSYRSEYTAPLLGHRQATLLKLNRLRRPECQAMIEHLAKRKLVPKELIDEIVVRADGVALFIEELTKAVLESEALIDRGDRYELTPEAPALSIPTTLNGSLMARLDRLTGAREVAQVGSVIGREFSYDMISAVSQMPDSQLKQVLHRLVDAELLLQSGAMPGSRFRFKHALVQDTAYESLLLSRRQALHARIAHLLEVRFPAIGQTEPALLAHHYTRGGQPAQAVHFRLRAGKLAIARSAMAEAIAELKMGLDLLPALPENCAPQRLELELLVARGNSLRAARAPSAPETGETWKRARQLCQEDRDAPQLLQVLYGQFLFNQGNANLTQARRLGEQLLALGEKYENPSAFLRGHSAVGRTAFGQGDLAAARTHLEQALSFDESTTRESPSSIEGPESPVLDLCYLAWTLYILGDVERAKDCCERSIEFAQQLAESYDLVVANGNACYFHQFAGNPNTVAEKSQTVISLATENGFPAWLSLGEFFRGWALAHSGDAHAGIPLMEQSLAEHEATGEKLEVPYFMGLLADRFAIVGRPEDGLRLIGQALALVERTGERWFQAELYRLQGRLVKVGPEHSLAKAEDCFHLALEVAGSQEARMWQLRAAMSLASLWADQDRGSEAQALLEPITARFDAGSAAPDLDQARSFLADLQRVGTGVSLE